MVMMMAAPPQHSFPSSSTTPASTLVVERDGIVGSQDLQPQIQPPIPPIHQREREQQEEEEEEQDSHTSPPRRRNSLPSSSSATHISTRDINDIGSDSRPRNRKWKRAKYVFFWIYDDHWIYVIWLSVVILFLSVMGWICKFRYLPSYMYSDLIMCFLFRSL